MNKLIIGLIVVSSIAAAFYLSSCPCERLPGLWLFGDEATAPVTDWTFVNDANNVPLCQLEVTTWRPHSINLNCMSKDGELYVSCSNCAGKRWSQDALSHPKGKLRAAGTVYPVHMERVTDPAALDRAWTARLEKTNGKTGARPAHWWSFQLTSTE